MLRLAPWRWSPASTRSSSPGVSGRASTSSSALGRRISEGRGDAAEEPDVLAPHVRHSVARILALVPAERRVDAANELLELAATLAPGAAEIAAEIAPGPTRLEEVLPQTPLGVTFLRPQVPLSRSDLLVNGRGEPALAQEVAAELTSADQVDLLCAFIKWYGLRLVVDPLRSLCGQGRPVRVITTTYVGATERRAVDELVRLGAQVKISYETQRTRLHARAWLFGDVAASTPLMSARRTSPGRRSSTGWNGTSDSPGPKTPPSSTSSLPPSTPIGSTRGSRAMTLSGTATDSTTRSAMLPGGNP